MFVPRLSVSAVSLFFHSHSHSTLAVSPFLPNLLESPRLAFRSHIMFGVRFKYMIVVDVRLHTRNTTRRKVSCSICNFYIVYRYRKAHIIQHRRRRRWRWCWFDTTKCLWNRFARTRRFYRISLEILPNARPHVTHDIHLNRRFTFSRSESEANAKQTFNANVDERGSNFMGIVFSGCFLFSIGFFKKREREREKTLNYSTPEYKFQQPHLFS